MKSHDIKESKYFRFKIEKNQHGKVAILGSARSSKGAIGEIEPV